MTESIPLTSPFFSQNFQFSFPLRNRDEQSLVTDNMGSDCGAAINQVGCILLYDQACMESCGNGDRSVIVIDWFDTILNHALVVANAAATLFLMEAIKNASIIEPRYGGIALPSYFASCLCLIFGKLSLMDIVNDSNILITHQ